jgi:ribonuclease J
LAQDVGFDRKNVFLVDDGQVVEFSQDRAVLREKISLRNIYVDDIEGKEVHQALLHDRQKLAEDGMLIIILEMDMKEGKVYGDIDIISRGFMDLSQNKAIVAQMKDEVTKVINTSQSKEKEWHFLRKKIEHALERFVAKKLRKNPLILPLIVEV